MQRDAFVIFIRYDRCMLDRRDRERRGETVFRYCKILEEDWNRIRESSQTVWIITRIFVYVNFCRTEAKLNPVTQILLSDSQRLYLLEQISIERKKIVASGKNRRILVTRAVYSYVSCKTEGEFCLNRNDWIYLHMSKFRLGKKRKRGKESVISSFRSCLATSMLLGFRRDLKGNLRRKLWINVKISAQFFVRYFSTTRRDIHNIYRQTRCDTKRGFGCVSCPFQESACGPDEPKDN